MRLRLPAGLAALALISAAVSTAHSQERPASRAQRAWASNVVAPQ